MNHYKLSNGQKMSKSMIDSNIRKAKQHALEIQFNEYGYNFCVDCLKSSGVYLDCSHEISVNECQKRGMAELAFDPSNIKIRCRECHNNHDKKSKLI